MRVTAAVSMDYSIRGQTLALRAGQTLDLSAEIGELLIARGFVAAGGSGTVPLPVAADVPSILAGTVADIKAEIAGGAHDAILGELADAESAGKDRAGIHSAIAARQEELEGE
jgi:hypothetical protein